ncbi:MAG: AlpA family phage regulatory protein [Alphaproteobacteria bacterium]|nr:MAG: AlpA family phage regulatory protein [Alphaproteobacteria bacterium]
MTEKILAISKVIEIVGFSARTVYKEVAAGRFPRSRSPLAVSAGSSRMSRHGWTSGSPHEPGIIEATFGDGQLWP